MQSKFSLAKIYKEKTLSYFMKKLFRALIGLLSLEFLVGCNSVIDTSGHPYRITNFQHELKGPFVSTEGLNAYLRTRNGINLRVWRVTDPRGNKYLCASGKTYRLHFVTYSTDKSLLDENNNLTFPQGYLVEKIQ